MPHVQVCSSCRELRLFKLVHNQVPNLITREEEDFFRIDRAERASFNRHLTNQVKALEIQRLRSHNVALGTQLEDQAVQLRDWADMAPAGYEDARKEIAELRQDVAAQTHKIRELEELLAEAERERNALKWEVRAANNNLDDAARRVNRLKREVDRLEDVPLAGEGDGGACCAVP